MVLPLDSFGKIVVFIIRFWKFYLIRCKVGSSAQSVNGSVYVRDQSSRRKSYIAAVPDVLGGGCLTLFVGVGSRLLFFHQSGVSPLPCVDCWESCTSIVLKSCCCLPVAFLNKIEEWSPVWIFLGGGGNDFYFKDFLKFSPENSRGFFHFGIGGNFSCLHCVGSRRFTQYS